MGCQAILICYLLSERLHFRVELLNGCPGLNGFPAAGGRLFKLLLQSFNLAFQLSDLLLSPAGAHILSSLRYAYQLSQATLSQHLAGKFDHAGQESTKAVQRAAHANPHHINILLHMSKLHNGRVVRLIEAYVCRDSSRR